MTRTPGQGGRGPRLSSASDGGTRSLGMSVVMTTGETLAVGCGVQTRVVGHEGCLSHACFVSHVYSAHDSYSDDVEENATSTLQDQLVM